MSISSPGGRRRISHGGAVSGYATSNQIYPNDRSAIVVFSNIYPGAAGAPEQIAERIANTIFAPATDARELARRIYDALTKGTIDRAVLTPAANAYFTQEVLADYATSLAPLGSPTEFVATGESLRGGMTIRSYRIRTGGALMELMTMTLPDGRVRSVHRLACGLVLPLAGGRPYRRVPAANFWQSCCLTLRQRGRWGPLGDSASA